MKKHSNKKHHEGRLTYLFNRINVGLRTKLVSLLAIAKIIPIILLTALALRQVSVLGIALRSIAVEDASEALHGLGVENIERASTDLAQQLANFLYERDDDIRLLSALTPDRAAYQSFMDSKQGEVVVVGDWALSEDGSGWVSLMERSEAIQISSSNPENEENGGFHYRAPDDLLRESMALYDEITFIDLNGMEQIKILSDNSDKVNYPMSSRLLDISDKSNTYVSSETYWQALQALEAGDIYVSDVIGAYVGTNYIGTYTPENVAQAAEERGYEIAYEPEEQAFSGMENPLGQRFEGIVRWAMPVTDEDGNKIGYVTMALNHTHLMEIIDHVTPMSERYTHLNSAADGNYAFVWDYQCRSIIHPRHHSIVGYDPETGEEQVPWLETSIYEGWQESGVESWQDYVADIPSFYEQSREKTASAELTRMGLVGLDGRYLNNAPQCTGWMDLTQDGGSGSFYILWSGVNKLNTAAAIPYYTGQYAPSEENDYSRRGFGFVAIGSGVEDFTRPATEIETKLTSTINTNMRESFLQLIISGVIFVLLVIAIAFWLGSLITGNITWLLDGIHTYRSGHRQFRFHTYQKDEFGVLANGFDDMANSIEESVQSPLTIISNDKSIIYVNELVLSLRDMRMEQLIGKPYFDISIFEEGSENDPILALEEGREPSIIYLPSSDQYIRGKASYFTDENGERLGYIILLSDITMLEKALQAANEANHHKSDFLARMSHEIRTPMNAILGLTNLTQRRLRQKRYEEANEYVMQIETSSQHLLGLLNNILDLSKIESGKIELSEDTFHLRVMIDTVMSILQPRCEEKGIALRLEIDDFNRDRFWGDALRLRQILINILGNAVKFTPAEGEIVLSVKKAGETELGASISFSVRDNGVGIAQEAQEAIFSPFEQADQRVFRRYGGTGLGLSISRSMVQAMGGDISLRSELGGGSEFYFTITLAYTQDKAQGENSVAAELSGKLFDYHILLVDDVDINRMIVKTMLEDTDATIEEAADGQEALERVAVSPVGYYDLIFMDIQMPIMDGYAAARAIRALERPDAESIEIVALTANAFHEDIRKAEESGMGYHIAKPVELETLMEVLAKALGLQ